MIHLSALDQSPVRSGGTPSDAVQETIRLAQAVERLGYRRYWLAEHHGTDGFAGSAPGDPRHPRRRRHPRYPGRIGGRDAESLQPAEGRGNLPPARAPLPGPDRPWNRTGPPAATRAPPGPWLTDHQVGIEYFPARIADLVAFLEDSTPATEAFSGVRATPKAPSVPEVWLLGSSAQSAMYAAQFGIAFSFAHFITPHGGDQVLQAYREQYNRSGLQKEPEGSLCVFVICAETEEEARRLAVSRDLWRLRLERGELGPYPSPDEALAYPYSEGERIRVEANRQRTIVGAPDRVKTRLESLAEEYAVDELVILTITHDFAARVRSYELLAEAFGLEPRTGA